MTLEQMQAGGRTLRESERYTTQCKALFPDIKRLDAQLEGITWVVSTDPYSCASVINGQGDVRMIHTEEFPDAPQLLVIFTIDSETHCTLQWIERMSSPDEG